MLHTNGNRNKQISVAALVLVILVACSLLTPTTKGQPGKTLNLRYHRQHTQVWCWAASIAMVVEYLKGTPIEDCQVLSLYDRRLGGPGQCCEGDPRCQRGSLPGEIGPILGDIFGIHGKVLKRGLSWEEIVQNIDDDKPVIAWFWNSPATAHVVVIVGYQEPRLVRIFDPMAGPKEVSFDAFAANWGPQHNWNISWVFSSAPAGGNGGGAQAVRRQVECQHRTECAHRTPCVHQQQCMHRQDCVHRMPCSHQMPCQHTMPCQHPVMTPYGWRPAHPFDTLHPFDVAHPFDLAHPFDTAHMFDTAHAFDVQHQFDTLHEFDYEN